MDTNASETFPEATADVAELLRLESNAIFEQYEPTAANDASIAGPLGDDSENLYTMPG